MRILSLLWNRLPRRAGPHGVVPGHPYLVVWEDSATTTGWTQVEEASQTPITCVSIGFCVYVDEHVITLAQSTSAEAESVDGTITIPWAVVDRVGEVREIN